MPTLGQSSGAWLGGNSALRILYIGIRNTFGVLAAESYTQANPPCVTTNVSDQVPTTVHGVLSGSVAFLRPDLGNDFIGGPGSSTTQTALAANATHAAGYRALGCFLNNAVGNAFENQPGVASGRGTHTTGMGTFGNALFETKLIANSADAVNSPAGHTITYFPGCALVASRNGYLMPSQSVGTDAGIDNADVIAMTAESFVKNANSSATVIGVLRQAPDSSHTELIYDQRI